MTSVARRGPVAAVIVLAVVVVLVLGVAQVVLPGVAAGRLRDRLARSGDVRQVQVDAFPAIKLLWHHADKVVVRMGRYRAGAGGLHQTLDQLGDAGTVRASAAEVDDGLLTLHDAALSKDGNRLRASGRVTESALRSALPILSSVTPVASGHGRLELQGTATLFGVSARVDATVSAQDGKLVVAPDLPFGGLATVTVFSDPHIAVQSVNASPAPGGFMVTATATVR